ncbi:aldehyde dehydrogenase family protein [Streptomyces sp. AJS327]|uniref:aldehyde dehydrogenase family protein n=1 Tax=Streptomyces sp. AJS327 TaxID=2545265 RepID=UPI0027E4AA10|nr:aldehyde dehydrogenase family protein [Streptomyces sp. AJS327]
MDFLARELWHDRIYSGSWIPVPHGSSVVEPATGAVLGRVGRAEAPDVDRAVTWAAEAQRDWSARGHDHRAEVLRRAAALFVEHAEEIAYWTARESGAARPMAGRAALVASAECHEAAALAALPYGEVLRSAQPRLSLTRRRPVGVVGVISPFNAPLLLAVRALAPALALGNAVVLKPDPRTAVCGGAVLARIFEAAGLPEGLLHVLPGGADVGRALVRHPRTPVIAFTGSTDAGRELARTAGELLKRVHLELGGNSALVVLEDADVGRAAAAGAHGSFHHAGQICMATGRHLVHRSLAEEYVAALAECAEDAVVGDPRRPEVTVGPLIDERQRDRVHQLVTASVTAGGTLVTGGGYQELFYQPTVLTDLPEHAPAYAREVFGPVAPVIPFDDEEEAVRLAADSAYGLSLGVLTRDVLRGLAFAERVPTGLVHINDQTVNDEPAAPFGGLGDSGNGARHGGHQANLDAFTETQWVTVRAEPPHQPRSGTGPLVVSQERRTVLDAERPAVANVEWPA